MITSFASSLVAMLCAACGTPSHDPQTLHASAVQVESPQAVSASTETGSTRSSLALRSALIGNDDFEALAWPDPQIGARVTAGNLSTPVPIRKMQGDVWGAGISIGASGEHTGLGLDVSITPHAGFQRNQAGESAARAGAEFRLGANLIDRDLRGTSAPAPSWYLFVGAENEALAWNIADRQALNGIALRDQATVGDLQAGVAWTMKAGGQVSIGLVEREVRFKDPTGENNVNRTDRFAAFSFTLHH